MRKTRRQTTLSDDQLQAFEATEKAQMSFQAICYGVSKILGERPGTYTAEGMRDLLTISLAEVRRVQEHWDTILKKPGGKKEGKHPQ